MLARHEPGYERDPTKKIQLLTHLAALKHARVAAAGGPLPRRTWTRACASPRSRRCCARSDEAVAREPLLELFVSAKEESLRIRIRIAEGFAELGWLVHGHRAGVEKKLPDAFQIEREAPTSASRRNPERRNKRQPCRNANDIKSVLLIGSGPIVIGQACEFDYSGHPGREGAARKRAIRVVLVNSNPATIMTDPELADRTYVEPLTVEVLDKHHRARAPGRAAAHAGRADRAEPGARPGQGGRAGRATASS